MADRTPYSVEVWDLDEFFRILQGFPSAQQYRVTEIMADHLTVRPKAMIPGVLKALSGRWAGVYQLECGGSRRLLYEIDDSRRVVRIFYLGAHPQWDKLRQWGSR